MQKVIYITSLSHSGSTVLDLLLGSNPTAISLGEIYSSVARFQEEQRTCTCGASVNNCAIWGELRKRLEGGNGYSYTHTYKILMNIVRDVYGPDITVVDSSKYLKPLTLLAKEADIDLKILYLIKDMRNFVISQNMRKNKPQLMIKDGWRRLYSTSYPYNILRWYAENRKIQQQLNSADLKYLQFGYEELCLRTEQILEKISRFTGDVCEENILPHKESGSHIIRGNEMRFNGERMNGIRYDHRWFLSSRALYYNWLFAPFMSYNNKNVYANTGISK